MPRITVSQSVAAGATFDAFANSIYRYLPWHARIRVLAWTTAVGVLFQSLSGSELIQPETPVDIGAAAAGHLPTVFEVDPLDFAAPRGDLLQMLFRNTTAGALNVMAVIDVNPG